MEERTYYERRKKVTRKRSKELYQLSMTKKS
nr:MAG TPA: hypothetical protein [Caudoviricetes sp.]